GSLVTALAALPIFWAINTGTFLGAVLAMIIAFPVAHSVVYATSSGFISGLFDPQVRYTGASISYQVGGLISSVPAPMNYVLLYTTYLSWVPVSIYLVAANLLAGVFVFCDDNNSNSFQNAGVGNGGKRSSPNWRAQECASTLLQE